MENEAEKIIKNKNVKQKIKNKQSTIEDFAKK
jgi:hypothetical protein